MDTKTALITLTARIIKGLPAPYSINLGATINMDFDSIADAQAWLAVLDDHFPFDYRYEPSEGRPFGHRIAGGSGKLGDLPVYVTGCENLPGPDDDDVDTALAAAGVTGGDQDDDPGPVKDCPCEDCDELKTLDESPGPVDGCECEDCDELVSA